MQSKSFSLGEAIRFGWDTVMSNLGFFILMLIIIGAIQIAQNIAGGLAEVRKVTREDFVNVTTNTEDLFLSLVTNGYISQDGVILEKYKNLSSPEADLEIGYKFIENKSEIAAVINERMNSFDPEKWPYIAMWLILQIVIMVAQIGAIKIYLCFCDGEKPRLSELFRSPHLFFIYFFASILYFLICLGGFILLIIPCFIFLIQFQFYSVLIVDKNAGIMDSLKLSSALTKGVKWDLFVMGVMLSLINIAGALCLLIGLFVTIPTTALAYYHIYRQLSAQEEPQADSKVALST